MVQGIGNLGRQFGRLTARKLLARKPITERDTTDEVAAYRLASEPWPGLFGVFLDKKRPTKNQLEADLIARAREKTKGASDLQLLQSTFARLR